MHDKDNCMINYCAYNRCIEETPKHWRIWVGITPFSLPTNQ